MYFKEDWTPGTAGHNAEHNNISRRLNSWRDVREFASVQAAFDNAGVLYFPAGIWGGGALTITQPIHIIGTPGAILNCTSLTCSPASGSYLSLSIERLQINFAGATGLKLDRCRANLYRVNMQGATETCWHITGGIDSTYRHVFTGDSPVGLLMQDEGGATTTTQVFEHCTFHLCSARVIDLRSANNSVTFRNCVFQSSGDEDEGAAFEAHYAQELTIDSCYWENNRGVLLAVATEPGDSVISLDLRNPFMTGGTYNVNTMPAVRIGEARITVWMGGDCRVDKSAWVEFTDRYNGAVHCRAWVIEPMSYGAVGVFSTTKGLVLLDKDGLLHVERFVIGGSWQMEGAYTDAPGDLGIAKNNYHAFQSTDAQTKIGAVREMNGTFTGGLWVQGNQFSIVDQVTGERVWYESRNGVLAAVTP